jgi:NAD(P)-dependent dehydrogenase (short-subunit alcohol dehydrogenase family)
MTSKREGTSKGEGTSGLGGLGYDGARVVVTGAASGMGQATARILGDLGAEVHIVDVAKPTVPHHAFYETDLRDPAAIDATAQALAGVGAIDKLFNCAGVPHTFGPVDCMRINYIGLRYLAERLLPHLRDGAAIATIASDAGMGYLTNMPTCFELLAIDDPYAATAWCESHLAELRDGYSFSKEMLIVWTMQTAVPLAESRKIRTNAIGPCPTNTAFMVPTVADVGQAFFDRFPMPLFQRMATPEEQAWPLVLLNSDLNAVVSGTILYTDQGFAAGMMTGQIDPANLSMPED